MRRSALSVLLVVLSATPAFAGDSHLDLTFGTDGIATSPVSTSSVGVRGLVTTADDRILIGLSDTGSGPFHIVRLTTDGAIDTTWGTAGVATPYPWPEATGQEAIGMQSDGSLIAASLGMKRLDSVGSIDPTFGTAGIADGATELRSIAVLPDDRIVALNRDRTEVRRYLADGSLDATFGTGGVAAVPAVMTRAMHVAPLPDGRIVLFGSGASVGIFYIEVEVAALNAGGTHDTSWGTGGLTTPGMVLCGFRAPTVQPDGKTLLPGCRLQAGAARLAVARLDGTGQLDGTFGIGGFATLAPPGVPGHSWFEDAFVQPDGKIVAVGGRLTGFGGFQEALILARFLSDGTPDPTFNGIGWQSQLTDPAPGAIVAGPPGHLLVGAQIAVPGHDDIVVIRFGGEICGNGGVDPGEECDDFNLDDGDCCSSTCEITNVGAACTDDGNPCSTDVCDVAGSCSHPAGNEGGACPDDGDQCTDDLCASGVCTHPTFPDGTSCEDGEPCTVGDTCQAGACEHGVGILTCGANDYVCHKMRRWNTESEAPYVFDPIDSLPVANEIEAGAVKVKKAIGACVPTEVDDGGLYEPAAHFVHYKTKPVGGSLPHERQFGVIVTDRFGTWSFDTIKADRLLSPATADWPLLPPDPILANHHQCYRVRPSPGSAKLPKGTQVMTEDRVEDQLYDVRKANRLCIATDAGTGLPDPDAHLMCYIIRRAHGTQPSAWFADRFEDSFGQVSLLAKKPELLCVPAAVTLP